MFEVMLAIAGATAVVGIITTVSYYRSKSKANKMLTQEQKVARQERKARNRKNMKNVARNTAKVVTTLATLPIAIVKGANDAVEENRDECITPFLCGPSEKENNNTRGR